MLFGCLDSNHAENFLKHIFEMGVDRKFDFRRDLSNAISGENWLFRWDCAFSGGTFHPSANYEGKIQQF